MKRVPDTKGGDSTGPAAVGGRVEPVAGRLRRLYGEVDWRQARGVLHVAAIEAASGRVLIPGPAAPASAIDRFILGLARARSTAIVTTGAILRSEPDLRHDFGATPAEDQALREWRQSELELREEPRLIVLSASGEFPLDHPAIVAATAGTILTTEAGARRLPRRVARLEVSVGPADEAPIAGAIGVARAGASGDCTVAIEAGPHATAPLYATPADDRRASRQERCDELLLSRFEGSVDPRALGPAFFDDATIDRVLASRVASIRIEDESGSWRFERYR